jgi:hypothetical protein
VIVVVSAAAALASPVSLTAAPSRAATACATPGYSYAGYASAAPVRSVAATLTAARVPSVASGHVAAWVGVGSLHAGPDRANEWLQAGIAAYTGSTLRLYVELARAGAPRQYVELSQRVVPGERHDLAVVERSANRWQALVDGRAAGPTLVLPAGAGGLRSIVTAESWTAGRSACNRYAFAFRGVRLGSTARVRLAAPVNRVRASSAAFTASA